MSDDRGIAVRIPAETRDFSLLRSIPTDTGLDAVRPGDSFPSAEWPVRETNHSLPHNAEVNEWRYTSPPPIHLYGMCRDCFTCYLTSHLDMYCRTPAESAAYGWPVSYRCTSCFVLTSLPAVHKIRCHYPVVFNKSISILASE